MAEEQPKENQEVKLPDTDDIPEKLRGKTVDDVVTMYKESEKNMHGKSQEAAAARKTIETLNEQIRKLQESQETTEEAEIKYEEDDYPSIKDVKSILAVELSKRDKEHQKELEEVQNRTMSSTLAQIDRIKFIEDNEELFSNKTPEQVDETIQSIVAFGLTNKCATLKSALKKMQDFAQSNLGLTASNPSGANVRQVPGSMQGVQDDETKAKSKIEDMKAFAKKDNLKLSSRLKPL